MVNSVRINNSLYVDVRFYEFLRSYDNRVSALILSFDTIDSLNYISIHNSDMISFLPKSKYKSLEGDVDPYSDGIGRMNMKVGRLISKLFPKELISQFIRSESDVERFVNLFKSHFDDSLRELRVVEGDEIKKWYNEKNYLMPDDNCFGTLWNSCMRYQERMKFLNFYTDNPEFKMLIMIQKDQYGKEKVRARALLVDAQTTDDSFLPKGTPVKVMDRIYTVYDSDVNTFKKWAADNGYISKYEQTAKSKVFFSVDDENKFISLVLRPKKAHFNYYPYLDTFSYFRWDTGEFFNNCDIRHDYVLVQANGALEPEEPNSDEPEFIEEDSW